MLTKAGYYKLEVWGAQGGSTIKGAYNNEYGDSGGYGGYSVGVINSSYNDTLYVYVGGQGISGKGASTNRISIAGGYNGGGIVLSAGFYQGSGGGATHIAKVSGLLQNLSTYKDTSGANISKEILIVAGGGGGSSYSRPGDHGRGANGGGIVGNTGYSYSYDNTDPNTSEGKGNYATGGSQTTGGCSYTTDISYNRCNGAFGKGGDMDWESQLHAGSGGGGWYGGGTGRGPYVPGGGGGSGYIGSSNLISGAGITKHMTCYSCTTSTATGTRTNSNTNVSATATADYSKTGNGYARITYLGASI